MSIYDSEKASLTETARDLTRKGYLMATGGNLSMRARDGKGFLVSPSNRDYLTMDPSDICLLDWNLQILEGSLKPSVESGMHAAIYRCRPDIHAIVHTHQVYASALTLLGKSIPALFDEQARFLGRKVALIPYAPSGTGLLAAKAARFARSGDNAFLMKNHGVLCFGHDLERAAHNVEILEKCSIAYLLALCTGTEPGRIPLAIREIAFAKLRADEKKYNVKEAST